jgi:hypothetical protein
METDTGNQISNSVISKANTEQLQSIPFESEEVLGQFDSDPQIIAYNIARKLAWIELSATDLGKDMGWERNKLSKMPVVYYGFDNKPKSYDFMVLDAEEHIVGTLTAYARKSSSTIIRAVFTGIKDYSAALSKAGNEASLFIDWAGNSYAGIRGKADDLPASVVRPETGELVEGIRELDDAGIIQVMKTEILPALLSFNHPAPLRSSHSDDERYDELLKALENQGYLFMIKNFPA